MWLELTALTGKKTLVCFDRADSVTTGYDQPGCVIHFSGGGAVSVSDEIDSIKKAINSIWGELE